MNAKSSESLKLNSSSRRKDRLIKTLGDNQNYINCIGELANESDDNYIEQSTVSDAEMLLLNINVWLSGLLILMNS